MAEIKAIETVYNGYKFRSRLEARWAVFFDDAGIKYEYEPEGFKLSNGLYYLPDFFLPEVGGRTSKGIYVEVKAIMTDDDSKKIWGFCGNSSSSDYAVDPYGKGILIVTTVPKSWQDAVIMSEEQIPGSDFLFPYNFETICCDHYPALFYKGKDGSVGLWGPDNVDTLDGFDWFNPHYLKARQARFEHGDKG